MRSVAAYTSKIKSESLGRAFKVQDTDDRVTTDSLYRGAAGCGALSYEQLIYKRPCCVRRPYIPPFFLVFSRFLDGGNPVTSGPVLADGGNVTRPINSYIGGTLTFSGGTATSAPGPIVSGGIGPTVGGTPIGSIIPILDGGTP